MERSLAPMRAARFFRWAYVGGAGVVLVVLGVALEFWKAKNAGPKSP